MTHPSTPQISIVVPTRDRQDLLDETLESLLRQALPHQTYEVIVVDDGSRRPVQVPEGVRLLRHDRPAGPNAARNTGAREARSEIVCLVDDDVSAPPEWLRNLTAGIARYPAAWCFGGPIRLRLEGISFRACSACIARPGETELELGNVEGPIPTYVFSANMAVRKAALDKAGPFDEKQPIYFDEIEWQDRARRSGGEVVYLPDAWLWHRRTAENMRFRKRFERNFRMGRGSAHYAAAQGLPQGNRWELVRWLAHTVHHRCPVGVLNAVREVGRLVGMVEFAYRRRLRRAPGASAVS